MSYEAHICGGAFKPQTAKEGELRLIEEGTTFWWADGLPWCTRQVVPFSIIFRVLNRICWRSYFERWFSRCNAFWELLKPRASVGSRVLLWGSGYTHSTSSNPKARVQTPKARVHAPEWDSYPRVRLIPQSKIHTLRAEYVSLVLQPSWLLSK